jgi:hypothetical protein
MAAAYAESGCFPEAAIAARKAAEFRNRQQTYQAGKLFRE